jgi:TRAP-type C4-dicarboxylate transport system permease small subunit
MIALLIILIPGFLGIYGWKLMRDAIMLPFGTEETVSWLTFLAGFVLFVFGIAFIAGFVFHRDKKRRRVQPRFLNDLDN